jgi:hypothetical protein
VILLEWQDCASCPFCNTAAILQFRPEALMRMSRDWWAVIAAAAAIILIKTGLLTGIPW